MQPKRAQFKVRTMMAVVALVAVSWTVVPWIAPPPIDRLFLGDIEAYLDRIGTRGGQLTLGVQVACITTLLIVRICRVIVGHRRRGTPYDLCALARIVVGSTVVSTALIVVPSMTFLVVYTLVKAQNVASVSHGGRGLDASGIVFGVAAAMLLARWLRKRLWATALIVPATPILREQADSALEQSDEH